MLSALKDQVHRHGERNRSRSKDVTAEAVVNAVFKSLSLEPALAIQRTKISPVSRGRALVAWLWVERPGHAQVEMADALNLSPGAVAMMLSRLRREGLKKSEKQRLTRILKTLTEEKKDGSKSSAKVKDEAVAPKVVILKRQQRR